ncbi:MAG: bifunctional UDP-N-acetylglucosamine diphosphorylase/glucosamine-1-phosphate N-acetyltransferase GlmU [Thermomicrobiales bacterium]
MDISTDHGSASRRNSVAVAVLAAGHGTRMKSDFPKHLHAVGGIPIVERVIRAGLAVIPDQIVAVVSPRLADLPARLGMEGLFDVAVQEIPRGTADAVRHALDSIGPSEWLISLLGDSPLLTGETVSLLFAGAVSTGCPITVLTCILPDAQAYGRIARDGLGRPCRIVERKNDDVGQRQRSTEINSGIMVLKADWARDALARLALDAETGEFLLTDLIGMAVDAHVEGQPWPVATVVGDPSVALGVNDRVQLADADAVVRDRVRRRLRLSGVTIVGPETVFIDERVEVGQDSVIMPFSVITGDTRIGRGCRVGPHAVLHNAVIADRVTIAGATIVDSEVGSDADVGPYSHLRSRTRIGADAHVGNFVEMKNTYLGDGAKCGHVSYLGDTQVGRRANIGAGTITANFDGTHKHPTQIGDDAFIGSDSVLIAPVTLGNNARTGAGSVVTHDVPASTTVVGVPARPFPSQGTPHSPSISTNGQTPTTNGSNHEE